MPSVQTMTDARKNLLIAFVPESEAPAIWKAYSYIVKGYIDVCPDPASVDIDNAPRADRLDTMIKEQLVALAKSGVTAPLKKLSRAAYVALSPDYGAHGVDDIPAVIVHRRLHQSDFLLTEYRDLSERQKSGVASSGWTVQVFSARGEPSTVKRTFPLWGVEVDNKIDNMVKAIAFYREALKQRQIL